MVSINYNDNDSHEKVAIIMEEQRKNRNLFFRQAKVLLFQVYRYILENNSLSFYSKRDPENLSEFFK